MRTTNVKSPAIRLTATTKKMLADMQTPVSIYLKVRDMYPESALLESSDYNSSDNSYSFIGIQPMARFTLHGKTVTEKYPNGTVCKYTIDNSVTVQQSLNEFIGRFEVSGDHGKINGLLGYTSFDVVHHFDNIELPDATLTDSSLPEMVYILYRYIISVNHLSNEMSVTELNTESCADCVAGAGSASGMSELLSIMESRNFPSYDFRSNGEVSSTITDCEYMTMVERGIAHCMRGDVFQIVLSRRFMHSFSGDDFKVYRALRSINPSPYLFYFDFGSYRIFGSSPETHLKIEGNTATIDPIAGTFLRTGNDAADQHLAEELRKDAKENAEHVMLVDLARNDLSRNASGVYVKNYKEIQFYSHVIHMVSRVCGTIDEGTNRIGLYADTFPAGTLSGAPKVRAMQLISEIESHRRGVYGGSIGYVGFDGDLNQAITIRTFLSCDNRLSFQAGAGIVAKSSPESELREVNNKLAALRKAIVMAEQLKN